MSISVTDVKQRPQDFVITVDENPMNLTLRITIKDRVTTSFDTILINSQDPYAAFFLIALNEGTSDSQKGLAADRRNERQEAEIRELKRRVQDLRELTKELRQEYEEYKSSVAEASTEETEYAYVEGWDEF